MAAENRVAPRPAALSEAAEMHLLELWHTHESQQGLRPAASDAAACGASGPPVPTAPASLANPAIWQELLGQQVVSGSPAAPRLTPSGVLLAGNLIRRRRLAELLLHQALQVPLVQATGSACRFEHIISEEVADRICAFLGHPTHCPHGRPIPPGACCARPQANLRPLVQSLAELPVGARARVLYITLADENLTHRLASLGLYPGGELLIRQARPALLLRLGQTELALDPELATAITCRQLSP